MHPAISRSALLRFFDWKTILFCSSPYWLEKLLADPSTDAWKSGSHRGQRRDAPIVENILNNNTPNSHRHSIISSKYF
jgi:hypothetical protein